MSRRTEKRITTPRTRTIDEICADLRGDKRESDYAGQLFDLQTVKMILRGEARQHPL